MTITQKISDNKNSIKIIKKDFEVSDFEAFLMIKEMEKNELLESINKTITEGLGTDFEKPSLEQISIMLRSIYFHLYNKSKETE